MTQDTTLPSSGSYHHGSLRNALIAQGRLELEKTGPQELSLRSLARSVGVSEAAPARHFAGKAGLLAAIAADGFRELAQSRVRLSKSTESELRIAYRMMESYVAFARKHRGLFNLMVGPRIVAREDYPELLEQSAASFMTFAEAIRKYAVSCGWESESLPLVVHGAWAMEHGIATLILSDRVPRQDLTVSVAAMAEFSINMFLAAVHAGPAPFAKLVESIGGRRAR